MASHRRPPTPQRWPTWPADCAAGLVVALMVASMARILAVHADVQPAAHVAATPSQRTVSVVVDVPPVSNEAATPTTAVQSERDSVTVTQGPTQRVVPPPPRPSGTAMQAAMPTPAPIPAPTTPAPTTAPTTSTPPTTAAASSTAVPTVTDLPTTPAPVTTGTTTTTEATQP
ncbi:MAG: hypothetical protein JWO67_4555 [Streptosporangiaceae bacterium]|nr:hypothetical protein [Streptosporangiaceae bacterium]